MGAILRAIVFLVVVFSAAQGISELIDEIVATVDGNPITLMDLKAFIRRTQNREIPSDEKEAAEIYPDSLDGLITDRILEAEVSQAGIKVSPEEVEAFVERVKAQNRLSQEQFLEALKAQGVTLEKYREQVRRDMEKSELLQQRVRSRATVSRSEVEEYYRSHSKEFTQEETIRVRHLVFPLDPQAPGSSVESARLKALEVRERALKGEDFSSLIREYSKDPSHDGDLGFFARGVMEPALEEAAFALPQGGVSEPIHLKSGFHLIKLEERRTAGLVPLAEVEGKIREKLYTGALEERFKRVLKEDLRKKHTIEVRKYRKVEEAPVVSSRDVKTEAVPQGKQEGFLQKINPLGLLGGRAEAPGNGGEVTADPGRPLWIPWHPAPKGAPVEGEESEKKAASPLEEGERRGLPVILETEEPPQKPQDSGGVGRFLRSLSPF